jgi:hypothetical protein
MVNSGLVERLGKGEEGGEGVDTPRVSVNYPRQAANLNVIREWKRSGIHERNCADITFFAEMQVPSLKCRPAFPSSTNAQEPKSL